MSKTYSIECDTYYRTLVGDREETHADHEMSGDGCAHSMSGLATVYEAMAAARGWLDAQEPAAAHDAKRGIGCITWAAATICEDEADDDGEIVDSVPVAGDDNLTSEVERAFARAKASYYGWLDYQGDGYDTVSDCMLLAGRA